MEVGGYPDYDVNTHTLNIPNSGTTAEIMVIRGAIGVDADDVIFQHLRAQPGDEIRAPVDSLGNDNGSNVIFKHW
ncbi:MULTISPECIES: hypothetical protein [Natrialbaceae]|uniref:hypothetical protein n=1 Tax=Natrialbaceae TaxID=1644061 RepID=UPI00207CE881|nr:hypothetical protein [Natronococcus sp. CG52]